MQDDFGGKDLTVVRILEHAEVSRRGQMQDCPSAGAPVKEKFV